MRIGRMVGNLLGYAITFTESGQVSLTATSQRSDDHQMVVLIAVTGIGLDAHEFGHLSEGLP